mmetsp:Transcript_148344/g.476344  ORF Transcript_148344/g.476344 Transcript_148344/m.476344 type:complete len:176 (-) Transcript_148344:479-1006(-)
MFETSICSGIYSIALAGVLLIIIAFAGAKRQNGCPTYRSSFSLGFTIFSIGMAARLLDHYYLAHIESHWNPTNIPPFHHCFTLGMLCGGASLAAITFVEWCSKGRFIKWRWRPHFLAVTAPLVLGLLTWLSAPEPSSMQYYPTAVWYFSFRFAPLYGFPAFLWTAAARWGVRMGR